MTIVVNLIIWNQLTDALKDILREIYLQNVHKKFNVPSLLHKCTHLLQLHSDTKSSSVSIRHFHSKIEAQWVTAKEKRDAGVHWRQKDRTPLIICVG